MSKTWKKFLIAGGSLGGCLLLAVLAVVLLVDLNSYRSQLEARASDALGMEVRIAGHMGFGFWPGLHVTLADLQVRNRGTELAVVPKARLGIEMWPLLRGQIHFYSIWLLEPGFFIERSADGTFNFQSTMPADGAPSSSIDLAALSITGGSLHYLDRKSGDQFTVETLDLGLSALRQPAQTNAVSRQNLSFAASGSCKEIRGKQWSLSKVAFTIDGKDGVFEVNPITLSLFGGSGSGDLRLDYSQAIPTYQGHFRLSEFHLEETLRALAPGLDARGSLDFTAEVAGKGKDISEIERSITGRASLLGENLTLHGQDLDMEISRYESSQHFNLVDLTAVFLAGPIGLAATKGYTFASLVNGSEGSSEIRTLVSIWTLEDGVAHAKDVAMATRKNRIALTGGIDFPNQQLVAMTVAVVDAQGCATVEQTINGPLQKPVVERPNFLASLAGPAINLFQKARDLLPGGGCKIFYAGSVTPPN